MRPRDNDASREMLMRKLYAAFNRRAIDEVLASMHPDVVWPNGWEGGYVRGRAGVRDYWTRQWAEIDPMVTPTAFAQEADGRLCLTVDGVVRDRSGRVLSRGVVEHVYQFEDGLIKTMEIRAPRSPESLSN